MSTQGCEIIDVGIIDQDTLDRYALEHLLRQASDMRLVMQWTEPPPPCELQATELDVLIVSMETLVTTTANFVQTLQMLSAHAPVLSISAYTEPALVVDCLRAGVRGFLWKGIDTASVMQGIRCISVGERPIMPPMAERLVTYILSADVRPNDRYPQLTNREEEVLSLIACGLSNKEIAGRLSLSVRTVKAHVSNVLRKLDVADRTQAALVAARIGMEINVTLQYRGHSTKVQ